MFARSVIALLPIYSSAIDFYIYIYGVIYIYRFARLNGCVKSIVTDCWMISGKIAKIIRAINK